MIPTFLDLKTGQIAKGDDWSFYWWTEGNGSCDCNRAICFEGAEEELEALYPGVCYGCKRFIAIDVEGSLISEDWEGKNPIVKTKEEILVAMNSEYLHRLERP